MNAPAPTARRDLYAAIHKALRHGMTDTLLRCGRLDGSDPAAQAATLAQLDELLGLCARHLQHEDDFLHPAIATSSSVVNALPWRRTSSR